MANTITVNKVTQSKQQFQGLFTEMWVVTATIDDQDAVAINDTLSVNMTVPGVVLGDMVIGTSINLDHFDGEGDGAVIRCEVGSANTLLFIITADKAEFAADTITGAKVKVLIGRPGW